MLPNQDTIAIFQIRVALPLNLGIRSIYARLLAGVCVEFVHNHFNSRASREILVYFLFYLLKLFLEMLINQPAYILALCLSPFLFISSAQSMQQTIPIPGSIVYVYARQKLKKWVIFFLTIQDVRKLTSSNFKIDFSAQNMIFPLYTYARKHFMSYASKIAILFLSK